MSEDPKALLTLERRVITYGLIWHASKVQLRLAKEDRRGSILKYMASLTFTAFALEAFLNEVGPEKFGCWPKLETLGPIAKLSLLSEKLGVNADYGTSPYGAAKELFKFRNSIAHGKRESTTQHQEIVGTDYDFDSDLGKLLEPEWWLNCNEKNTVRIRTDVEKIIRQLHELAEIEEPVFSMGMQFGSVEVIDSG